MFIQKLLTEFILSLLFFCVCSAIRAQPGNKDSATSKSRISPADFNDFMKQDAGKSDINARLDSLKKASSYQAPDSLSAVYNKAALRYDIESLDHRHRVFEWQLSSSKYIFIVVNIIVLVGLLLSVWQFYLPVYKMNKLMKTNTITKEVSHTVIEDEQKKETQVSTIKLGKDGVEITSPVIGLLILVISIAFFFLYIRYVYPVSEITHSEAKESSIGVK